MFTRIRSFRSGLTLPELLVIITVLTGLAAILLPGLSQVRSRSRANACAENLRIIGSAALMYARDAGNVLPYAEGSALPKTCPTERYPNGSIATSLREQLIPYIVSESPFRCPNDNGSKVYGIAPSAFVMLGSSYLWNDGLERGPNGTARLSVNGASLDSIRDPHRTPMCWDYSPDWHQALIRKGAHLLIAGRLNVVYVDGHTRTFQPAVVGGARVETGSGLAPESEAVFIR